VVPFFSCLVLVFILVSVRLSCLCLILVWISTCLFSRRYFSLLHLVFVLTLLYLEFYCEEIVLTCSRVCRLYLSCVVCDIVFGLSLVLNCFCLYFPLSLSLSCFVSRACLRLVLSSTSSLLALSSSRILCIVASFDALWCVVPRHSSLM
jgi:hypothetical protein